MAFKVKDKEKFETLFHHYFDPDFKLYSYEEILQQQLFGIGEVHLYFKDFIGDFIAVALGFLRANIWVVAISMFLGKAIRYWVWMEFVYKVQSMF